MAAVDVLKKNRAEAEAEARALLESVGLSEKADSHPAALSGGQQQRAAIARAMAMHPEILLFDEPTSALDPSMVSEVLDVMREIARTGTTMLIVTHEMRFARTISSRIFYMDEGVIYEDGSPDQIFNHPQREKTRAFILRIRSWSWRIECPDHDHEALLDSLHVFLRRQYLDRRLGLAIELVLEEALAALLKDAMPGERVNLELTLSAGEGADEAELTISYPELKSDPLADETRIDPLTRQIFTAYAHFHHQPETRQASFRIHTREGGADHAIPD
jgi:ABC-type sulfate/molybdate transport systems ATPase subunit